jgi:hypothetical protein
VHASEHFNGKLTSNGNFPTVNFRSISVFVSRYVFDSVQYEVGQIVWGLTFNLASGDLATLLLGMLGDATRQTSPRKFG